MTRVRWFIAGAWLLLFWLVAGTAWVPALQKRLQDQGQTLAAQVDGGHGPVAVIFQGQHARISGKVRHETEKQEIGRRITLDLRLPGLGAHLNPVTQVQNDIEVSPYPAGWIMMTLQGSRGMLHGTLATETEARDFGRLLEDRWSQKGGRLVSQLRFDSARFDEAAEIQTTLDLLPTPQSGRGGDTAQVHITRPGAEGWERLVLDATEERLREHLAGYPISEEEWSKVIQPALLQTRRYQEIERARVAESERQARLIPPHVLFAARDQRLLLRGELASLKIKRELLNTVIGAFPDWRVLDDLRVNDQRRAVAEFGPITTALLPLSQEPHPGKALAIGFSGAAWQFVDWQEGGQPPSWHQLLPADLPPVHIQEDMRMVSQWLQGDAQGIPTLPIPAQPSFLTLSLLPEKVILAGQLAEEPLRSRLIEAARKAYTPRAVVFADALLARGTCQPTAEVEQTVRSFPALPTASSAPILAFARPGEVWKTLPATPNLLKPGALAASGLTPDGFPAAMAEDTFQAEAYDHLRHYWRSSKTSASPDSPTHPAPSTEPASAR